MSIQTQNPTFAEVIKTKATVHKVQTPATATRSRDNDTPKPQKNKKSPLKEDWMFWTADTDEGDAHQVSHDEESKDKCPSFKELCSRIKEVIYLKKTGLTSKIRCVF
ncbi:unnamed protein product [Arctia plantaginis]|uniref:Uncharacterized protein n=1 Tax=Arctia plantaginis TaxID=874455 RepID=A0A8S1B8K6_ARCPL|nr:unnamed protein product [Arctia plantaginis]CAB3255974.1 unnamed protein product [Arctia plantaginis]